jgi:hypothetical protein
VKKSFTGVVALLAGASVAYAQGFIVFGNYTYGGSRPAGSPSGYMYVTFNGIKIGVTGGQGFGTGSAAPVATWAAEVADIKYGDDWTVALYGAAGLDFPCSDLLPLIDYSTGLPNVANLADNTSDSVPGTWYVGGVAVVPNDLAPYPATIQVFAWYNEGGMINSLSAAQAEGVPWGASAMGSLDVGVLPTGQIVVMPNLGNIELGLLTPPNICPAVILNNSTNFGVRPSGFSFTVFCASNATVVVEASTDLVAPDWLPVLTNSIVPTNGAFNFSDPEWANYPGRFYRIVAQ